MIEKIYNISGFDCPNCAAKAEAFLSKQENVEYVHLDFSNNKLYIKYKNSEWSIKELADVISKVESDPLCISEYNGAKVNPQKIFTPKMWFTVGRIIFAIIMTLICVFALAQESLNWVRFGVYLFVIIVIGYDIFYKVIVHIKNKTNVLDHNLLISIAAIGALSIAIIGLCSGESCIKVIGNGVNVAIDESFEAVMVITLFQIGVVIENVATNKSKAAIMSAVELRVDKANLIEGDSFRVVKPEQLNIGDYILITTGEMIPADGVVISGEAYLDTSSLTGEYVPVRVSDESNVMSGCLVKDGTLKVKVTKEYKDSTINKIIELIESGGEKKSKADEFIAKFAKWYTPIVCVLAILVFLIGGLVSFLTAKESSKWLEWLHTGLEILVIGCPCAIVISVPLAYFSAIGLASKHGIVVKGGNYLDKLANLGKLITDKTGTLTHGSFTVQVIKPHGVSNEVLLDNISAIESLSKHPIGRAIIHDNKNNKKRAIVKDFIEIAGFGCEGIYKNHHVIVGNERMMNKYKISYTLASEVGSVVYCSVDGEFIGYLVLSDVLKEDAQPMVDLLHSQGVEIILLTGDHDDIASDICKKLSIDRWHSELLPEDKTVILEKEMENCNKSVAFIGDGVNDAPSIIRSDVGIAMGGIGSDIAVQNADVIIMNDDPAKVYDAMKIAKMGRNTSIFNIVFALTVKLVVFILALIYEGQNFMMYVAVLADTGLTVLLVINSLLLLYRKVKRNY